MHYKDAKTILSPKNGMNPYRGCTHGCIYCDSRSLCYGMAHAFEDVEVKQNAPQLLGEALRRKRSRCMIGTGSMCDPYLPIEATEQITRRSLALAEKYGFGFTLITKSDLVLRDLDLLKSINHKTRCVVQMTLTTYDEALCRVLEPHVCTTRRRAEVLNILRDEGIPTVVWLCPILPFINDTEENLLGILDYCLEAAVAGILNFGMGVTLRQGNREYFYQKLDEHFPGMKARYTRAFGQSYVCASPNSDALTRSFVTVCRRHGMMYKPDEIFAWLHRFTDSFSGEQLRLF
ncbi:MAG: radical SAM protein [Clostridia bacterium]|nr:radical SAM protein [Clostridia bacterium]